MRIPAIWKNCIEIKSGGGSDRSGTMTAKGRKSLLAPGWMEEYYRRVYAEASDRMNFPIGKWDTNILGSFFVPGIFFFFFFYLGKEKCYESGI